MPKSFIPTNVGFIVNLLREKKKLRAVDLARKVNIGKSNIHAIENIRTNPSLHTLIRIFNFFGYEIRIVNKKTEEVLSVLKFIDK